MARSRSQAAARSGTLHHVLQACFGSASRRFDCQAGRGAAAVAAVADSRTGSPPDYLARSSTAHLGVSTLERPGCRAGTLSASLRPRDRPRWSASWGVGTSRRLSDDEKIWRATEESFPAFRVVTQRCARDPYVSMECPDSHQAEGAFLCHAALRTSTPRDAALQATHNVTSAFVLDGASSDVGWILGWIRRRTSRIVCKARSSCRPPPRFSRSRVACPEEGNGVGPGQGGDGGLGLAGRGVASNDMMIADGELAVVAVGAAAGVVGVGHGRGAG